MTEKSVQCLDGGGATQIWAWARIRFENGGVTGVPSPSPFLCGAIFAALQLTTQIGLYPFTGIVERLLSDDGNGGIAQETPGIIEEGDQGRGYTGNAAGSARDTSRFDSDLRSLPWHTKICITSQGVCRYMIVELQYTYQML